VRANSELVAVAWVGSLPDLLPAMVSTTLPEDTSKWESTGFITIGNGSGGVIGGSPNPNLALRNPVVSLHSWAIAAGSSKPPWGKSAQLLEHVIAGTYDEDDLRRLLLLPTGYPMCSVLEAYPLSEPRRIPGDEGAYAHFQMDLQLHWVEL